MKVFLSSLLQGLRPRRPAIPAELWQQTLARSPVFQHLRDPDRERLRELSQQFLRTKQFTGASGLELTDAMLVHIAAQACLPILELGLSAYRDWVGVIVYPEEFVIPRQIVDEIGVVHEYDDTVSGEAWEGGPVILSWQDSQMEDESYNVIIHEFAHKLDMLNGEVDGVPALHSGLQETEWTTTMLACYEDFCTRVDLGEELVLDPYGAEHPSEFFAVSSETFFANSRGLQALYPAWHTLLCRYYRQNPLPRP
ncbi:zinc-dependent peptidase [Azovibrio restrictus]|uniref:M90 family metallopeptidase n=1 Tax=Azovibrio restrictus TaxID=146938 RepID=UPI0026F0526E|nr:M90 family metallopeptidase [Azovibrio restrictus]